MKSIIVLRSDRQILLNADNDEITTTKKSYGQNN